MKLKNKLHLIPNILSISRIFLTIIIVILMFIESHEVYSFSIDNLGLQTKVSVTFLIAGILFLLACLTDFFDGFLARKYNWISDFGKIWDSISDKVLTNLIYISLTILNFIPFYFVLIMIFRDFVIDGYRSFSSKNGIVVPANFFGKIKFVVQVISIIIIFFVFNFKGSYQANIVSYYLIQNLFVILSTIISLTSGIIYIIDIQKKLKEIKIQNKKQG
ncbi:MAG: CDP-diacylglycerol--glycerol-3-phosphate 3-phosphatidyltransferase [Malacoplasma sp.]|nr:CDP-diacylglycerol--glycerol-3-phosphate 3-phosphatidyltransferase [Malacoplasma sp.]